METYYRLLVTLPLSLGAEAGHSLVAAGMELQDGTHLGKSGCGQFAHVCVSGLLHCLSVVVGGGASWCEHVDDIIHCRRAVGRHLLPEGFFLESGVLNVVGEAQGAAGREERVLFKASEIRLQGPPSEEEGLEWAVGSVQFPPSATVVQAWSGCRRCPCTSRQSGRSPSQLVP